MNRTSSELVEVRDLGCMAYASAFALQKELQQRVIAERNESSTDGPVGFVLLVEHDPPVITVSRRRTARQHLLATEAQLLDAGVEVAETDRGGDITYHGPGQLVVYPILDLNRLGLRLHSYMRFLEQIVVDTLGCFGIEAACDPDATGVWIPSSDGAGASSKICAMGVRVSRWVSMHGLALNVTPDLRHFDLIVPCGLAGRSVTSMQRELGEACPPIDAVKRTIVERMVEAIRSR